MKKKRDCRSPGKKDCQTSKESPIKIILTNRKSQTLYHGVRLKSTNLAYKSEYPYLFIQSIKNE
jgi:hypothetical protein